MSLSFALKRLMVAAILMLTVFFSATLPVSAHVWRSDQNISAELHIAPDDHPVSGSPTTYNLSFSDVTSRFTMPNCNCTASILENSKTIATLPLVQTSEQSSINKFTFPKADIYNLSVTGTPKNANSFQAFKLVWPIRVEAGAVTQKPLSRLVWVGLVVLILLVLVASYVMEKRFAKKK